MKIKIKFKEKEFKIKAKIKIEKYIAAEIVKTLPNAIEKYKE